MADTREYLSYNVSCCPGLGYQETDSAIKIGVQEVIGESPLPQHQYVQVGSEGGRTESREKLDRNALVGIHQLVLGELWSQNGLLESSRIEARGLSLYPTPLTIDQKLDVSCL